MTYWFMQLCIVRPVGGSTMYDLEEGIAVTKLFNHGSHLSWGDGLA